MPRIKLENQQDILTYKVDYDKILMQFSADWCGPCTRISPQITNKFEQLNSNKNLYLYIDVDKHKALSNNFNVSSIPTFFIYNKETDLLQDPVTTSDINELTQYCVNNGIPLNDSSY